MSVKQTIRAIHRGGTRAFKLVGKITHSEINKLCLDCGDKYCVGCQNSILSTIRRGPGRVQIL